ncbi:MAG: hypothetical protein ACR2GU_00320 [Rubrobacteraceae bacterium]
MRKASFLVTLALATMLFIGEAGTSVAEPGKNQIPIKASCDNGKQYSFVINGMGNVGHIAGTTSNIMPVKVTATFNYVDPATGQPASMVVNQDLGKGNKNGQQRDLLNCTGTAQYQDRDLGPVTANFVIQAFLTPRGNR